MAFDANGDLYVCQGSAHRVIRLPWGDPANSETVADSYEGQGLNWPNDLAVAAAGRVYFSDPNYTEHQNNMEREAVYIAERGFGGNWSIQRVTSDTNKPNGVLLSPDQKTLFVAESPKAKYQRRELRAYPILDNGMLGDYSILHDFGSHRGIDGMSMTVSGLIIACAGSKKSGPGPMIYVFTQTGRVVFTLRTPDDMPTNCAFGGSALDTLFVTFGTGSLYAIPNTGMRGHLAYPPPGT